MKRMPRGIGPISGKTFGNAQSFPNADDEEARPRLRHEAHRVYDKAAKTVFSTGDRGADRREILSIMRGESAADIFEDDERRRAAFFAELLYEAPERPEGSRTFTAQTRPGTRQRQILTRKRRPGEIGGAGQVFRLQRGNVGDLQMLVAPIRGITGALLGVNVVGEQASPFLSQTSPRHAPAREKLVIRPHSYTCPVGGSRFSAIDRSAAQFTTARSGLSTHYTITRKEKRPHGYAEFWPSLAPSTDKSPCPLRASSMAG